MKKIYLLFYFTFCILLSTFSQGGTWTWISGDSAANASGIYGTQGVPSLNNYPPGGYECDEWKDKQGNFWMYGGNNQYIFSSDLWNYNPVTKEWTWVKGNGLTNQLPVFGTQGVPNLSNNPGMRCNAAATWVDTSGTLWLFGGLNPPNFSNRNDLWKYNISTNEWIWIKGDSTFNSIGIYGIQGMPSPLNTPGARDETSSAWTDSMNNLWLFGGYGVDATNNWGCLNDLWKYDISTNEWTWVKGASIAYAPAVYGIKGVPDTSNVPGGRFSYNKWKDVQGNFWLMGGEDYYNFDCYNDVWKYDLKMNEWTWMSGTNVPDDSGNYHSTCVFDATNLPYSRLEQRSSVTDYCNRFWLFGGWNFNMELNFNDLWVFDPQQLKWNWINGSNNTQPGNYGTLGEASSSNMPPSRCGAVAWWGNDNKFYMFGGWQISTFNNYSDLWVFDPDTNCVPVCGATTFPPPIADFQVNQAAICANGCINFTDLSTNATSWQWSFAGALDSTSTAQNPQNICYSKAGIYNVTLIASNAAGSDTVTFSNYITVNAAPPTPVITQSHDTLFCSTNPSYTTYQWYIDSTIITSATDTFFVISKSGNYNVTVTNANNCSAAVGINIVYGIQNYVSDNVISIYPNPVDRELRIKNEELRIEEVDIYNILGQETRFATSLQKGTEDITIDVNELCSGIYFVRIVSEGGMSVGRFVKE